MRKIIMIIVTGLLLMSTSFKAPNKNIKPLDQNWGEWVADNCFKGIDYRTRRGDYNSYVKKWNWYAQIRNRYSEKVNISFILTEPGEIKEPDHRTKIDAQSIDGFGMNALLINSERCHFRVGYIRMGDNDSGSYYGCDK